jgi:hypothetical protein
MSIDVSTTSTPDPTAALRQARLEARKQQVSREAVVAVLPQLVLDTMFERTNALTWAVHDLMAQPPEDRWALDDLVKSHPYRYLVEVGRAFVRLAGEAWLTVADTYDQACLSEGGTDHATDRHHLVTGAGLRGRAAVSRCGRQRRGGRGRGCREDHRGGDRCPPHRAGGRRHAGRL